jgi:hypothetical protein
MTTIWLAISLLFCLRPDAALQTRRSAPPILIEAGHCLVTKGFLRSSGRGSLSFGYLIDDKTYAKSGEKVLYVVSHGPRAGTGYVFTIYIRQRRGRETFDIQNNARFAIAKGRLQFVAPDLPLGGEGTQQDLESAVKRIELLPRFKISSRELLAEGHSIDCTSYVDRRYLP